MWLGCQEACRVLGLLVRSMGFWLNLGGSAECTDMFLATPSWRIRPHAHWDQKQPEPKAFQGGSRRSLFQLAGTQRWLKPWRQEADGSNLERRLRCSVEKRWPERPIRAESKALRGAPPASFPHHARHFRAISAAFAPATHSSKRETHSDYCTLLYENRIEKLMLRGQLFLGAECHRAFDSPGVGRLIG